MITSRQVRGIEDGNYTTDSSARLAQNVRVNLARGSAQRGMIACLSVIVIASSLSELTQSSEHNRHRRVIQDKVPRTLSSWLIRSFQLRPRHLK